MANKSSPASLTWFDIAKRLNVEFTEFFRAVDQLKLSGRMHRGVRVWSKADMVKLTAYFTQPHTPRPRLSLPERIRARVAIDFAPHYVDRVTADMIDVATGNRAGNYFEVSWLNTWFPRESL